MIVAKFNNTLHKLVEQKDIKETVIGSHKSVDYVHNITCTQDPTSFDYLLIYVFAPGVNRNALCVAKYYNGQWYPMAPATVYRTISLLVTSSGTSLRIEIAEWMSSSSNNGCRIDAVVGVNRGVSLAKIFNWLAPRRKVVIGC